MKIVERYPANKLPAELRGDDIPADAYVRVIVQLERGRDLGALLEATEKAGLEAQRNGLTEALLEQDCRGSPRRASSACLESSLIRTS